MLELIEATTNAVASPKSRSAYRSDAAAFVRWYGEHGDQRPLSRALIQEYRAVLMDSGAAPASINRALCVLRALAREAAAARLIDGQTAMEIRDIKGIKNMGQREGVWLGRDQAQQLLAAVDRSTIRGKRDAAALALLLGCALRRQEAVSVTVDMIRQIEGRWVVGDLVGKGQRVRTVPVPDWGAAAIRDWLQAADIKSGPVLRGIAKTGQILDSYSAHCLAQLTKKLTGGAAPHDLRRTFAKLARAGGAPLEQIQMTLGHESIKTTQTYLGSEINWQDAACDRLGIGGSQTTEFVDVPRCSVCGGRMSEHWRGRECLRPPEPEPEMAEPPEVEPDPPAWRSVAGEEHTSIVIEEAEPVPWCDWCGRVGKTRKECCG